MILPINSRKYLDGLAIMARIGQMGAESGEGRRYLNTMRGDFRRFRRDAGVLFAIW